ncbi:hybrid sensor histidine kinase/response regulator transcription factor [Marinifilum sp. RC60d5]|uniref:hybrid sensor histidine kinase/response regulator transcription factor n=1 Tax=Marinifilum sp. RC60d5 TaxID=3458414 RepID=UPI00403562B2
MKNIIIKYQLVIALLWLPLFTSKVYADKNDSFSVFQLKNLPQNDVNCIFKDSKGFMWIGTLDGLLRFDGYTYKTYQISNDPESISSNMIIAIDEDSKGNIWIGTYGRGICKLNPLNEKFTIYDTRGDKNTKLHSNDVTCMIIDNNDVIWLGNWYGYSRIKLDKNLDKISEIITIPIQDQFTEDNIKLSIKKIHQDKEGKIWLGTNLRVFRIINPYEKKENLKYEEFDCQGNAFYEYEDGLLAGGSSIYAIQKQKNASYKLNLIYNLSTNGFIYKNQKIWSGNRHGISCLKYHPDKGWQVELEINKTNLDEHIKSNIVTSITEDEIGQIWVGTRAGGIYTIDLSPKKFKHYYKTTKKGSISSNFVQSVFEDHNKNLWIGTEDEGINFLSNKNPNNYNKGFKNISVSNNPEENRAYAIEETLTPDSKDHKSLIWVGSSFPTNLAAINPVSLKRIDLNYINENLGFLFTLESQGDSVLWAGSYGEGLWKLSLNKKGEITKTQNFTPQNGTKSHISSRIIRHLLLDRNNNLWIATDKGLNRIKASELNKANPEFESFENSKSIKDMYCLQIYEAKNGALYMGSMGSGLVSHWLDASKQDHFSKVTMQEGLPNNTVKSILEDKKGYLWLSTNKGLSRYNPKTGKIVNYDAEDGLQHNEFSEICAYKRANEDLIFGGINGFNVFSPRQIHKDTVAPKLFLTDFYILNKQLKPGEKINGKIILEKSIEYTKEIELNYNQNSFSIGFLGLYYNAPQKNKYKYILEGFDADWYNASASYRIAKYTNVPVGEYTFKVIAANSDNIWAPQPASISIKIKPPFYKTSYAYLAYFILLLLIMYVAYRVIQMNESKKKKLLIAEVEKNKVEEIAQIKLRFFTNISHEFRTPLTLITSPLNKLISKNKELSDEERLSNYKLIKQNANLLLRLVNQLMDFRRLDQNKMKLKLEPIELNQFVDNIYQSFKPWAEQKNININFEASDKEQLMYFDPEKIEKVIYNLLSNAFKFTPKNGSINLEIEDSENNNFITIYVSDTGIGIDPKEQEHIFERYYQSESKDKQSFGGTGIGLALCKGLVDMHKGTIEVNSVKGKGTSFAVKLHKGESWMESNSLSLIAPSEAEYNYEEENEEEYSPLNTERATDFKKNHYKILLVEDNIDLRNVVCDIFKDDFIVFEADDGLQGYEQCMAHQPDVIISDVMMPNMDGIELCQKIKSEEAVSHIPILLLTAKNTIESQIEGFEIGADAYIPKPYHSDILRARVISLLKNREKLRQKFQKEIEINPMIIANSPTDSKFLDQILAIIEKNLSESDFSIEKLAKEYGVSRIYLNRKIKALTGETSNQFLRNIRLKHAAELLSQNVLSVSEVTWQVGYNDLRTFRTRFKEKFGVSPSEYAKSNNK